LTKRDRSDTFDFAPSPKDLRASMFQCRTSPPPRQDELITPTELSGELKVPLATLYAWRHRGTGPAAIRVGRHLRYRRTDVAAWLNTLCDDGDERIRG
jgi:excisionase family DNA binding protein